MWGEAPNFFGQAMGKGCPTSATLPLLSLHARRRLHLRTTQRHHQPLSPGRLTQTRAALLIQKEDARVRQDRRPAAAVRLQRRDCQAHVVRAVSSIFWIESRESFRGNQTLGESRQFKKRSSPCSPQCRDTGGGAAQSSIGYNASDFD